MNPLLWNQLRKEVRQHRLALVSWGGLLLWELHYSLSTTATVFRPAFTTRHRS